MGGGGGGGGMSNIFTDLKYRVAKTGCVRVYVCMCVCVCK